jgi:D-galactarolactone cycloisomerase
LRNQPAPYKEAALPLDLSIRPARLDVFVLRHPIAVPVQTSFGVMRERTAVFIRIEDADGSHGWGEAWCNFPACGAEHRARLVETAIAPSLIGRAFASPEAAFDHLDKGLAILAIQSGEPGPFAQAIAGVDCALWDLAARRAGSPLWRVLGGSSDAVRVYASGLNPDQPEALAAARRAEGHIAFKLKVGFGRERDIANIARVRSAIGAEARLMIDANQAWTMSAATEMAHEAARFDIDWIEEPLRADRPEEEWRQLAAASPVPLAAGENMIGEPAFISALASRAFGVLQPDVAKWGGLTGARRVARRIRAAGRRFCPHYLGAGIGLLHSAHLLAAVGGDGVLEIDANDNPLRTDFIGALNTVTEGAARLGDRPGIGIDPDPSGFTS